LLFCPPAPRHEQGYTELHAPRKQEIVRFAIL
jgi:hypothetical protein